MLPTVGGQTALNLAIALHERGMLEKYNVKLIGASVEAIKVAEDRLLFRNAMEEIGVEVPRSGVAKHARGGARAGREHRLPGDHPPVVHDGRRRRRHRLQHRGVPRAGRPRPRPQPGARDPGRGIGHRLEGIRARGDARRRRQLRRHLLDREHRSDGRAHRRLDHRRAGADADRQGIPADARHGPAHHPPRRRRNRRFQHPVRRQPARRPDRRDRDEPARLALVGAGVEGHRVPDCQDRRQAGARLSPRRDSERHHAPDAGVVRADDRLHRRQVPALELREVPAGGSHADDADEVGGRGDGDRPHVQGGVPQGGALARAGQARQPVPERSGRHRRRGRGRERAAQAAGRPERPADVGAVPRAAARLDDRDAARADQDRPLVPAAVLRHRRAAQDGRARRVPRDVVRPAAHAEAHRLQRCRHRRRLRHRRGDGAAAAARGRAGPGLQAHRHLRRRVRVVHAVHVRHLRAGVRGRADAEEEGRHPRQRPEPDRPGHRVRLLLLSTPCSASARKASRR